MLQILLLIASRESCRNDRLSKAPFAFCLQIGTEGGRTIYRRSFSLLNRLEVVKITETCALTEGEAAVIFIEPKFVCRQSGGSNFAFIFQC